MVNLIRSLDVQKRQRIKLWGMEGIMSICRLNDGLINRMVERVVNGDEMDKNQLAACDNIHRITYSKKRGSVEVFCEQNFEYVMIEFHSFSFGFEYFVKMYSEIKENDGYVWVV
jgi:hypothetical protein